MPSKIRSPDAHRTQSQIFHQDGTEFNLYDEEAGEYVSEVEYNHQRTEFPVLPAEGDLIYWSGAIPYRVAYRHFTGTGGVWSVTLHVFHDDERQRSSAPSRNG